MSDLENTLEAQIRLAGLPPPEREFRFAAMACGGPGKGLRERLALAGLKDWRFDFAWPDLHMAVEVEGGAFVGGRHTRGKGFVDDLTKYHHAMRLGWLVYRCGAHLVKSGEALQVVEMLLESQWQRFG